LRFKSVCLCAVKHFCAHECLCVCLCAATCTYKHAFLPFCMHMRVQMRASVFELYMNNFPISNKDEHVRGTGLVYNIQHVKFAGETNGCSWLINHLHVKQMANQIDLCSGEAASHACHHHAHHDHARHHHAATTTMLVITTLLPRPCSSPPRPCSSPPPPCLSPQSIEGPIQVRAEL